MENQFSYIPKPIKSLKADYSRRKQKELNSFKDFEAFLKWYNDQEKVCYYCGLTEKESQEIVMNEILTSNRFPQKGKLGRGQSRGVWLEVDRLKPKANYSAQNCVLCCYFCNNDKSDVFEGYNYKFFIKDRAGYLRELLKSIK
jgi:hypothetical protein